KGIFTNLDYVEKVVSLVKDRANFVTELYDLSDFFFVAPTEFDPKALKNWKEDTNDLLNQVAEVLKSIDNFEPKNIENIVKGWISTNELPMGKIMLRIRVSIVGAMKGPDLFEIISMLGKDEVLNRISNTYKLK